MKFFVTMIVAFMVLAPASSHAGIYKIKNNQLLIDDIPQPQLFGAEVQYFRMRGGFGRNIPRAEVIKLWASALDRFKEAHMNAISFYIPWDFHEYAEGKFDFDGTADDDGDGQPDYPSRDVKTFFKMIAERGIEHIMVRPGPYVNAEWGFLGFGAIPLWFHQKYPESHMRNSKGQSTKLYDYHNEDLLRHTKLYFQKLYDEVLHDKIGPGKPISFLQLDNETNFMWQSLYNHDYGKPALRRYQEFLKAKYKTIDAVNKRHYRVWTSWEQIQAPTVPRFDVNEDKDWYLFADESVATYLEKVRRIWEDIGVHEPDVLFTIADSYNATQNGLLPNYLLHNQKGKTGLLTVNLYPKTYETNDHPLMNLPFKTDHDVKAAETASEYYFGNGERFAMGPEIQAGWWRGIPVSTESRQQTYLSVIGHGLKAMFVYYFNEGDNWQTDWGRQQIEPLYNKLLLENGMTEDFWTKLQQIVDNEILAGFDVWGIMHEDSKLTEKLYFDAPLAYGGIASPHFFHLKEIGEKLIAPHGEWLAKANEVTDPVCLLKDQEQLVPSYLSAIDHVEMNSAWAGGLLGYLLQAGINPKILHWGVNSQAEIESCQMIVRQDSGETTDELTATLLKMIKSGHSVVNFLDDSLAQKIGLKSKSSNSEAQGYYTNLQFDNQSFAARSYPLYKYAKLDQDFHCESILKRENEDVGYQCIIGQGHYTQVGALFYDAYNANEYGRVTDLANRNLVLDRILKNANITPLIQVVTLKDDVAAGKIVAFARKAPGESSLWVTVKSSLDQGTTPTLRLQGLDQNKNYNVKDLMSQDARILTGEQISAGFSVSLAAYGSTVYWVEMAD